MLFTVLRLVRADSLRNYCDDDIDLMSPRMTETIASESKEPKI